MLLISQFRSNSPKTLDVSRQQFIIKGFRSAKVTCNRRIPYLIYQIHYSEASQQSFRQRDRRNTTFDISDTVAMDEPIDPCSSGSGKTRRSSKVYVVPSPSYTRRNNSQADSWSYKNGTIFIFSWVLFYLTVFNRNTFLVA